VISKRKTKNHLYTCDTSAYSPVLELDRSIDRIVGRTAVHPPLGGGLRQ
jgi:hypothetical protein